MLIYLMRHGIATPRGDSGIDDASRALTPEGIEKVRRIGEALRRLRAEIDEVWTSPLVRAHQTAETASGSLGLTHTLKIVHELVPGGSAAALVDRLRDSAALRGVLLVGHEPDMGALASRLIGGYPGASVRFKKGSVACVELEVDGDGSSGELQWLLTPKQLSWIA